MCMRKRRKNSKETTDLANMDMAIKWISEIKREMPFNQFPTFTFIVSTHVYEKNNENSIQDLSMSPPNQFHHIFSARNPKPWFIFDFVTWHI